jgi:hypothetical protein
MDLPIDKNRGNGLVCPPRIGQGIVVFAARDSPSKQSAADSVVRGYTWFEDEDPEPTTEWEALVLIVVPLLGSLYLACILKVVNNLYQSFARTRLQYNQNKSLQVTLLLKSRD